METMDNVRYLADERRYTHVFDADKLDDIKKDAAEKGLTVEAFLAGITRRVADITEGVQVPETAEALLSQKPGKLLLTLRWIGSALDEGGLSPLA